MIAKKRTPIKIHCIEPKQDFMMRHDTLTYLRFVLDIVWIPNLQYRIIILSDGTKTLRKKPRQSKRTYFSLTDRNVISNDVTNSRSFRPHQNFELFCFFCLGFNCGVDLFFLHDQIIC